HLACQAQAMPSRAGYSSSGLLHGQLFSTSRVGFAPVAETETLHANQRSARQFNGMLCRLLDRRAAKAMAAEHAHGGVEDAVLRGLFRLHLSNLTNGNEMSNHGLMTAGHLSSPAAANCAHNIASAGAPRVESPAGLPCQKTRPRYPIIMRLTHHRCGIAPQILSWRALHRVVFSVE